MDTISKILTRLSKIVFFGICIGWCLDTVRYLNQISLDRSRSGVAVGVGVGVGVGADVPRSESWSESLFDPHPLSQINI